MADITASPEAEPEFSMRSTVESFALKFPNVTNITCDQLRRWVESTDERTVILLDTRPESEFVVSHIERAVRVEPESGLDAEATARMLDVLLQDKPNSRVVCYCALGYRSSDAITQLQEFYTKSGRQAPEMFNLEGSLFQWANDERPMVDSQGQATHFVHHYSGYWGKLLNEQHRFNIPDED